MLAKQPALRPDAARRRRQLGPLADGDAAGRWAAAAPPAKEARASAGATLRLPGEPPATTRQHPAQARWPGAPVPAWLVLATALLLLLGLAATLGHGSGPRPRADATPRSPGSTAPARPVAAALALCAITLAMVVRASGGSLGAVLPWLVAWGLSAGPIYVGLTTECIGDADPDDRGTASALFESTSHIGGAIAVATYLTVLGAGLDYALVQLGGAAAAGAAAIATLRILPATRPAPRSDR